MSIRRYSITLDHQAALRVSEVVDRLHEAGFEVSERLDAIGVLLGQADDARLDGIRHLEGIVAIEEQHIVELLDDDVEER